MSPGDDRARRRLREANPVSSEEVPSPTSPQGEALFHRVIRTPQKEPKRPFWRRRRGLLILVPAVALACAAGYSLISKLTDPLSVVCFQETSLVSRRASVSAQGSDPVSACGPLWAPGGEFNPEGAPASPLAACLLEEGNIGVFPRHPNKDTCPALGLTPVSGVDIDTEHQALQAVQEELAPRFVERCLKEREAADLVADSLHRHGLREWTVLVAAPFTQDRPCATLSYDLPSRTVSLVPASGGR